MRSVRAELLSSTGWFGSVHASEFEAELTRRSTLRLTEAREKASPRVEALGRSLATAAMPSVGMRRTTRVFGVVKGADGARVLRSGRRLWPDSTEVKLRKHSDGEDWLKLVKNSGGGGGGGGVKGSGVGRDGGILGGGFESNGWAHSADDKLEKSLPAPVVEIEVPKPDDLEAKDGRRSDKLFRIVYVRKRKGLRRVDSDVRKFEPLFTRRQRRRLNSGEAVAVANGSGSQAGLEPSKVVNVVPGSSLARNYFVSQFLWIVLVYMTRKKLKLYDLFAFLASEPIRCVNSLSGISIFLDRPLTRRSASCKIFGATQFAPLFSLDFSAVPLCFMNMYLDMFAQHKRQLSLSNEVEISNEFDDEVLDSRSSERPDANNTDNGWGSNPSLKGSKLVGRSSQYRSGLFSRGIQKRRSSLRRRRARNPSLGGVQKPNGLVSDLVSFRKNAVSLSVQSNNKLRRSLRNSSGRNVKEVSSKTFGSTLDKVSTSCCANVLVVGSDKCYREEGANIMLDMSPLREWVISVKKDGLTKFTHKAEKVMKPYASNRFTQAIMWTGDNDWKLEFPNRTDWAIFKDLYKECADRNVPSPGPKSIPIPGVNEVSQTGNGHTDRFCRPDTYISVKDNELRRAMTRKTPSYDMDSEDELWLKKFNSESSGENSFHVLDDNFELMVDAFEKAAYCGQFDPNEEKPPADVGLHLGSINVMEAVYSYWVRKRKQKQSSLLRVFQSLPAQRLPVVPRPLFRKKRSFKRQPSQVARGKHHSFLQGFTAARDAVEARNAKLKVEEAKVSAKRCMESALEKRRRAQLLMNNADLATFKASVAFRIAEGAAWSVPPAVVADHFLD